MYEVESNIREYLVERGWDKLHPSDLSKSISIEAAELLEIFQWSNATIDETKGDPDKMSQIRHELADVLIYAFDMAVLLDIDTKEIILDKLEMIKRKYPAQLMKANATSESGSGNDPAYLRIKQVYRSGSDS